MMTVGYSFNIWVPLLLFPTARPDGAPRWRKGWPVTFVFYFLLWLRIHNRSSAAQAKVSESWRIFVAAPAVASG